MIREAGLKVVLSTIGKFHTFDLARQLHSRGALAAVFTGYPRFKLRNENLPPSLVRTFPWIHAPYMVHRINRLLGDRARRNWEYVDRVALDRYVRAKMAACDVFVGLSGSALLSGRAARARGIKYVCDRGSTHIRTQDRLMREEAEIWGLPWEGIDPRIVEREEQEYAEADHITVPSTFNLNSFLQHGIPPEKITRIAYGVDLSRFLATAIPPDDRFDVLFVGAVTLRKGVQYLLQAFPKVVHPRKSLTLAGTIDAGLVAQLQERGISFDGVNAIGHVPQAELRDLMSRSHVLVLPSIEEGLAMVQAQAMACGCPVIASDHTGAGDLFTDSREGFIVGIRQVDQIAGRLQQLADDPDLRRRLSAGASARVREMRGWSQYGEAALNLYEGLLKGSG